MRSRVERFSVNRDVDRSFPAASGAKLLLGPQNHSRIRPASLKTSGTPGTAPQRIGPRLRAGVRETSWTEGMVSFNDNLSTADYFTDTF